MTSQHHIDVAQKATADRVNSRLTPANEIIIEKDCFVGRASSFGSGSMGGGIGTVTVTHAFGREPDPSQIQVTPLSANGTGWYVENVGATTFDVTRPTTTGTFDFAWKVDPI